METLARQIHETRIAGLYVDLNESGLQIPTEAIDDKQADDIISLAEARIEMCEAENPRLDFSSEELEIQTWLLEKTEDPESRKMIFSSASMKEMAELKNGLKWGQWLKYVFEEAETENLKPCLSGYHPHPLYVVCLLGLQARAGAGALRRRSG